MSIDKLFPLPTGYLFTGDYSKGKLETLSIGDYGKAHNIKADFLGFTRELDGVANVACKPLSEKWVITLSTEFGCPMKCNFCDVPNIPFKGNATFQDLKDQFYAALSLFPTVKYTDRLNIHYARMGDPIFNHEVFDFTQWLGTSKEEIQRETGVRMEVIHPVLTTSSPRRFSYYASRLRRWATIKNDMFRGQAGLQLSINSTDDAQREKMFGGMALPLHDIADVAGTLPMPLGRKYCLNFAFADDFIIDAEELARMFDPAKFMCKITPIHNNHATKANGIATINGYESFAPYRPVEESLKAAGFDVLVFVPSIDEEQGLVTCGNAVLGGGVVQTNVTTPWIDGLDK